MKQLKTMINRIIITLITIGLVVFSLISENMSVYGTGQTNGTSLQEQLVAYAKRWIGVTPYVWGGTSLTDGADCSGFVMKIYEAFGISIPHGTESLLSVGRNVSLEDIQLGDVIITKSGSSPTGRHTGIYAGNGQWVNAKGVDYGTVLSTVNTSKIISIRRIIGNIASNGDLPQTFPSTSESVIGELLEGFKPHGVVDPDPVDLDGLIFEFAGNPSYMEYNGKTTANKWLFSKFSQFIDYILGIMFTGIKGAIVGWTAIVEGMIDDILNLLNFGL